MDESNLIPLLEAAIFSSFTPLTPEALQRLFEEGERPALGEIRQALKSLQALYSERAIELKEVASGFRFQVREDWAIFIGRMHEIKPQRYSRALMETLALIAYRQPITRAEIEDIRGVVVSSQIIKTLLDHNWIRVVGYKEVPGRPGLYATTKNFLDHFNLKSLEDLPPLPDIKTFEKEMAPQSLALEETELPAVIENELEADLDDENDEALQPIQDEKLDEEVESDEIEPSQNPEVIS